MRSEGPMEGGVNVRTLVGTVSTLVFTFLRVKAATAFSASEHRNFVCLSVRPSVCHTGGSVKNGAS